MTVVVNCRFLERPVTGVERYAREITRALAGLRSDLVLVAPTRSAAAGTTLVDLPVRGVGSLSGHSWEQVSLPRFLRSAGEPLLLSLANTGPIAYANQVAVVHDVLHRRHPEAHSGAFRLWYRFLTPHLVTRARAVATVSEFSRREIEQSYGRSDIAVVPGAVGSWVAGERRRPAALRDAGFYLMVGSRSRHKGMDTAIDAFARYRRSGGSAELVVAGGSGRTFSTGGSAAGDGIRDVGRVADAELRWLYAHARALLFPSRYEGFGIPPLEAQSLGTPVIAADIPVLREVLADGSAVRFPPGDPAALAASMAALENDPGLADRLRANGRMNAARYSWQLSATRLSKIIDEASDG